ncbi:YueI family protein [Bacillus sp. Marseille-P3661]|uniref:YueI family protein n=1 Tax=Bacillus sp. Marseille-P3661 TaxID=1936234 RepID=UPI000C8316EF|nr:YueI family protein [Bacillus sp. Marseille-P3661]
MTDVNDYLEQGIHGPKEINKAERIRFLGTLRERVVVALKKSQVRESGVYQEVVDLMKQHPKAQLFLNGNMNYSFLKDYVKLATQYDIPYTLTTNLEDETDIGLVLAYDYAIDRDEIFIQKTYKYTLPENEDKGIAGFIKKIFK